ncbi:MAG: type III pantothenate kinase [Pseudomonadota bacterium]
MTALLLDIGNSRCKWGLWRDGAITDSGALSHEELATEASWQFAKDADRVIACNVAGAGVAERVRTALESTGLSDIEFVKTTAEHVGVHCAYDDPTRLGVDRWVAAIAVSRCDPQPAMVVDAGTAMTVDSVVDGTQHLGGYIVPGFRLMQKTLMSGTADIVVDDPQAPSTAFGDTTSDAVRNGALAALEGTVVRALRELETVTGVAVDLSHCWFSGGDGEMLAAALGAPEQFDPHLVLKGLAIHAELVT